jgi:glyceraldehyde 3-phosphate dehydrogenase
VTVLTQSRNPGKIDWRSHGVKIVIDTTGKFLDPVLPQDRPGGSLRGHLSAGARVAVASAPFKIKDKSARTPGDAVMLIKGINHQAFGPYPHAAVHRPMGKLLRLERDPCPFSPMVIE